MRGAGHAGSGPYWLGGSPAADGPNLHIATAVFSCTSSTHFAGLTTMAAPADSDFPCMLSVSCSMLLIV